MASTVFFTKPPPVDISAAGVTAVVRTKDGERTITIMQETWESFFNVWILPRLPTGTLDEIATVERLTKAMAPSEDREVELLTRDNETLIKYRPEASKVLERFGAGYYVAVLPFYRAPLTVTSEPAKKPEPKALPANGATKPEPPADAPAYSQEA